MSKAIRLGIIGYGNMGTTHSQNIQEGKLKNIELVAFCDVSEKRKIWAEEHFPEVNFFHDYKELIDSTLVDAVLIATPHYIHPDIAIYALEHGLHVLVEKPAGVYTKQVEEMNEVAKKAGKVFCIMYNQRTNPYFQKIRDLVKSGELGELKRFNWIITTWYRSQAYFDSGTWRATWDGEGGGVLINQCPHNLDLWQWMFGMPNKIWAKCHYGKWHNIEVEDDVTAYSEYENGATGVFITTTGDAPGTNRLEITGDRGKIVYEAGGNLVFTQLNEREREFCFTTKENFGTPSKNVIQYELNAKETGHVGILQNFVDAILEGTPLLSPGEEGIHGLTISNAIHLSDWLGNTWVDIPFDGAQYLQLLEEKRKNSQVKAEMESVVADLTDSQS